MKIFPRLDTVKFFTKKGLAYCGKNVKPEFIILGAQKAATTSLHNYLVQHPDFIKPLGKEIRYFSNDENYKKGERWYLSHFPSSFKSKKEISFDATPEYLYQPWGADRIFKFNPRIKLIAVLRNPVDRAYSAWNMYRHFFEENNNFKSIFDKPYREGFENNIKKEFYLSDKFPSFQEVVENEIEKIKADAPFIEPSILRRGIYASQLKRYFELFPKEQILILDFQDVNKEPKKTLNQILAFIGLQPSDWNYLESAPGNKREYSKPMSSEMRIFLNNFFEPHNRELYDILGKNFSWNK